MNRRELIALSVVGLGVTACSQDKSKASVRTFSQIQSALSGFAVNLESWWSGLSFEDRFDKAGSSGFEHVEFWFIDSWKRDVKAIAKKANDAGVKISQIVADSPALADSKNRENYLDNVKRAIENAKILGTDIVTVTGHQNVEGIASADALKAYHDHMAASAELWEEAQIYCAIEPFNPYDHPGHFIYVQIADSPARHQPGTGEVNYLPVLNAVRGAGYNRPIGLELWAKDKNYDVALEEIIQLGEALQSD